MKVGIVEEGIEVVGKEGICEVWNMDGEWKCVYVSWLEVYRSGVGNGKRFWGKVEKLLKEIGVESIGLECKEGVIGFWEKMGFEKEGYRSSCGIGMGKEI